MMRATRESRREQVKWSVTRSETSIVALGKTEKRQNEGEVVESR